MPWLTGWFNLAMLLGLAYLGYKLAWVPVFAVINSVLTEVPKVLRRQAAAQTPGGAKAQAPEVDRVPLWPLAVAYLLWGYWLARMTAIATLVVGQAVPLPAWSYRLWASCLLALYIAADRVNMLKYTEARGHAALRAAYQRLGGLIVALGLYGLLHVWFWPEWGGRGWMAPLLGWGQQLLSLRGAGVALGVVGLLYLFRLGFRLVFHSRRRKK